MIRKGLIILLAVALIAVPAAAEDKNWSYTITSSLQTVTEGLPFGCNLVTTDYVDTGYDLPVPPDAYSQSGCAAYQIYESPGVWSKDMYVQAMNAPLTPDNDETVFFLNLSPDISDPTEPFTITWDPVADANLPDTITAITLTNLSDTSETYDMLQAGSATGTGYTYLGGMIVAATAHTYSITVTYHLDKPVANFTADTCTPYEGETITFTDTSTGIIDTYLWDFGDETTSSVQNPTHTYTRDGTYTVTLTTTNEAGSDTKTETDYITVRSDAPVASFTTDVTSGDAPLTVTFTDTSVAAPGKSIVSWSWDFGDDTSAGTIRHPTHTYTIPGTYNVSLTVTDDDDPAKTDSSPDTMITVAGPAPVADFCAAPILVSVMNGQVSFTDLSTSDNFSVISWNWAFGDGTTSSLQHPDHTYTAAGLYTVSLTAGDSQTPAKTDTKTKQGYIEVVNAPTADFTWPGIPHAVESFSPATVTFTDASAADGNATLTNWSWDFGTGTCSDLQAPDPVTFTTPGWYDIFLNVSDDAGGYAIKTKENVVHVFNDTPVAGFTAEPLAGYAPLEVHFTDTSTGVIDTYAWNFGNGDTSTEIDPDYTYTEPGLWDVSLTVTNDGGSDTFGPVQINVTRPAGPYTDFRANITYGVAPVAIAFTDLSSGTPTGWNWNFGDNTTSIEQNPIHRYTSAGNFTVCLTADGCGECCTKSEYITITPVLFGDANNDNQVNQVDTLRVLKEVVGLTTPPTQASGDIFTQSDVHKNGVIDVGDAMFIAQHNVGLRGPWFELI